MTTVQVTDEGRVLVVLEPDEAALLADLSGQVASLIADEVDDSSFARLFPAAYRDDPAAAAEFERYERAGLADAKVSAARAVQAAALSTELDGTDDGEPVSIELDRGDIWPWLTHLTDLRTVLADRLGIEDDDSELEPSDETLTLVPLYDWLGWLQSSLVTALESLDD